MGSNQRKNDRFTLGNAKLGFSRAQSLLCDAKKKASLPVVDFSKKGVQVLSDTYVMKGVKCDLQLDFPSLNGPLVGRAKVMWVKKVSDTPEQYRIGFKFVRLRLKDAKRYKELLEKLSQNKHVK